MNFVTLELVKQHIVLDDIVDEENYLEGLATASEALALKLTGRTASDIDDLSEDQVSMYSTLTLQLCEDMYRQRGASSSEQLHIAPMTQALACSLRKLTTSK